MNLHILLFSSLVFLMALPATGKRNSNQTIDNFNEAKKYLAKNLDAFNHRTIYCSCITDAKKVNLESCGYKIQKNPNRASRLEWEHVVPAEAFGKSFPEWRGLASQCERKTRKLKGRKCAETNPEFDKMEGDLYNLFPEIGELNGLRSNYSMANLDSSTRNFGNCKVKLAHRKFEPQDSAKGIVARTYLNFNNRYPNRGIVSNKNEKLFLDWNKQYPITRLECKRWDLFEKPNGYRHFFSAQCLGLNVDWKLDAVSPSR